MAIPATTLDSIKTLLRRTDEQADDFITATYTRVLDQVSRTCDWLAKSEEITSVTSQSIYAADSRVTRILAVLNNKQHLAKLTAWTLDTLDQTWESTANATPEYWMVEKIPPALDALSGVTSEQFAVIPPPSSGASSTSGLILYEIARPASDAPTVPWITPLLVHGTVGAFLLESGEERERDTPATEQIIQQTAQFFTAVQKVWRQVLERELP